MPDLNYRVEGAEAHPFAAAPTLCLKLGIAENVAPGAEPTLIHSLILRCQIRIEPARRSYSPIEQERLNDLFGTPQRWGQTLRPMLWTHVTTVATAFEGDTCVDLLVPCSYDFSLAATKYFAALDEGELPLCLLFSGTVFYETDEHPLQVAQISWEKEAEFRLPAATWRALMDHYYPNSAWLCLRRDAFDRLDRFRRERGLTTCEQALERLVEAAEEPATP